MSDQAIQIPDDDKRAALARLLDDEHLDGADRLRGFLTYVVDEELAGRGADIRGKTIAQDVYGRDTSEGTDPENVVRVDARRLRQFLELYYEGVGKTDPVRLHMDSGGYRPRFEVIRDTASPASGSLTRKPWVPVAAFGTGALIGAVLSAALLPSPPVAPPAPVPAESASDATDLLRRVAIYEKSPAALQAFNLAQQARVMIFPIFDRPRQELVFSVFERVIEIDPDYYGGYAGAAQALATLSVISPPSASAPDYALTAMQFADEAVRLAPDEAWSQSAKSWAYFANGDYDSALRLGKRAAQMDPKDGAILDFLGAVALFSGDFEEAVRTADRHLLLESGNQRFANRNISGAAHFHLGEYQTTVDRFEEAKELGDPLSAPSLAYATAALASLGRKRAALTKLSELERAWPNAPIETMLKRVHRYESDAEAVISKLESLGWTGVSGAPTTLDKSGETAQKSD